MTEEKEKREKEMKEKAKGGFEEMQKCGEVKSAPYVEGLGVRVLTSSNKIKGIELKTLFYIIILSI